MQMIEYIGIIGAGIVLVFFIANEWEWLSNESSWYDLGNALGASMLAYYAYQTDALPFLILNIVWAVVAWRDVVAGLLHK